MRWCRFNMIMIALGWLAQAPSMAQFNYVGVTSSVHQSSAVDGVMVGGGAWGMYRPRRNWAIGLVAEAGAWSTNRTGSMVSPAYSVLDARLTRGRYEPTANEHLIEQGPSFGLFGRWYFERKAALYLEARFTYGSITETDRMSRPSDPGGFGAYYWYGPLDMLSVDVSQTSTYIAPAVFLGATHHASRHFWIDIGIGVDMLPLPENGYTIAYEIGADQLTGRHTWAQASSRMRGTIVRGVANLSMGYLF